MTLGVFVPAVAAFGDALVVLMFWRMLRALPGRTEAGYDEATVVQRRRGFQAIVAAAVATPILLYVVLNHVSDLGAMPLL